MKRLVVTPCGGAKRSGTHPAAELYTGGYFTACLRYARALADDREIRILSARHGLIELGQPIAAYEQRFNDPGAVTGPQLCAQAAAQHLLDAEVIVLGGKAYTAAARRVWPAAHNPIENEPGIGYQLRALKQLTRERTNR